MLPRGEMFGISRDPVCQRCPFAPLDDRGVLEACPQCRKSTHVACLLDYAFNCYCGARSYIRSLEERINLTLGYLRVPDGGVDTERLRECHRRVSEFMEAAIVLFRIDCRAYECDCLDLLEVTFTEGPALPVLMLPRVRVELPICTVYGTNIVGNGHRARGLTYRAGMTALLYEHRRRHASVPVREVTFDAHINYILGELDAGGAGVLS